LAPVEAEAAARAAARRTCNIDVRLGLLTPDIRKARRYDRRSSHAAGRRIGNPRTAGAAAFQVHQLLTDVTMAFRRSVFVDLTALHDTDWYR
jgi:hypothetical protein